jgi:hypothetical protein
MHYVVMVGWWIAHEIPGIGEFVFDSYFHGVVGKVDFGSGLRVLACWK